MGFVKHHILTCEAYFFTGQLVMLKSVPFGPDTFFRGDSIFCPFLTGRTRSQGVCCQMGSRFISRGSAFGPSHPFFSAFALTSQRADFSEEFS
jgi:hypothetical protein